MDSLTSKMIEIPMMDSYLETLAGYISDEDKLVTYKWLSKELEVHVNMAKIILGRYWEKHKSDKLVATFMLIGKLKDGGMRVEVVRDADLMKAREKYEEVISEHIYSLQKTLLDIESLAGAGKGDIKYSAIKYDKNSMRSDEELLKMRWGKMAPPTSSTEAKTAPSTSGKTEALKKEDTQKPAPKETEKSLFKDAPKDVQKSVPKDSEKSASKENEAGAKDEDKTVKKISPTIKGKANDKKGGIPKKPLQSSKAGFGNLFGKAMNQPKAVNKTSNELSKKVVEEMIVSPEKKSVKAGNKTSNELSKKVVEEITISPEKKSSKIGNVDSSEKNRDKGSKVAKKEEECLIIDEDKPKDNSSKNTEKKANAKKTKAKKNEKIERGKKRGRSRDSHEEKKKRKRIFVESDSSEDSAPPSEDDDMFESPPQKEASPARNKSPEPPQVKMVGNKRKVSKMIDETFVDEDGFLVTRKKQVYESASEEEVEMVEPKKKSEPEIVKENKANVRQKQTSLMNFFKKA